MASTTTNLTELIRDLKSFSKVQESEKFSDPNDFIRIVVSAARRHNKTYVVSLEACTIPAIEHNVVVLLAWAALSRIRASAFATQPSVTGSGVQYGTDRNTPFYKCMELAKQLEEMYKQECVDLGLTSYAGNSNVIVTEVTCENLDLGAQTPVEISLVPPPISLGASAITPEGTLVLSWTQSNFANFDSFVVLHSTETITAAWNFSSAVLPGVADSATVMTVFKSAVYACKFTDLNTTVANHFLVVCKSKSGKYTFSNEVVVPAL